MTWYYMSFSDGEFLGAVIIEADDLRDAVRKTHEQKLNPGGEIKILTIPPDADPPASSRNRLMDKAQLAAEFGELVSFKEFEEP